MRYPSVSYPPTQAPRPPAARYRRTGGIAGLALSPWMLFTGLTGLFGLVLLPLILLAGTYFLYTVPGHTFPGVMVGSLPAGNMTRAELARRIDAEWNQKVTLKLNNGQQEVLIAPAEIGLRVDAQASAERAYRVGRGQNGLVELLWLARFQNKPVEPVVILDTPAAQAGLQKIAGQLRIPAQEARLRYENGKWSATPGQNGSELLVDATLQKLSANTQVVLMTGALPLVMQPIAPRVSDLSPALDQLQSQLNQPLQLQAYDPITNETLAWQPTREILAGWVTVEERDGMVGFGLDGARLSAYLDEWKASLGPDRTLEPFTAPYDLTGRWQNGQPVTLMIRHNPTTYTVEAGDTLTRISFKVGMPYWKIQQANPNLDVNHLSTGQVLTIPSKNDMLPVPVVPNKRIVVSISQQHMWTYENGAQRSEYTISTGIDKSPTIPGVYQIRTHDPNAYASVWDLYMPHFMGIYEGWPGFMNGIHGLPTLSNGKRLWDGYLGRKVSYGCIILGLQEAEDLYNWAEEGVVVEIQP